MRNLTKNKVFTLINVFGLFIGLTAFLLIYSYVNFEKNYDKFHPDSDSIYRVITENVVNGVVGARDAMSFSPLGKAMMDELPEVETFTTSMKLFEDLIFQKGDELIKESNVVAADERFLNLFPYKLLHGNLEHALDDPYSLVLTKRSAMRLFNEENPTGRTITGYGIHNGTFKVTAVLEDIPDNTHYKFEILLSFKTIEARAIEDGWGGYNYYTYVKLKEGIDAGQVQAKMFTFSDKYLVPESTLGFTLQPMLGIHLTSGITYEPQPTGNAKTLSFLFIVALFIITIAWVNYINLSTARAMDRAKEVGLRKVVGATRGQLIGQFIAESLLINLFGAILALTAVQLLAPFFNNLMESALIQDVWINLSVIKILTLLTVGGSLLSGFYPALVLSSFKPVAVLKGKLRNSKNGLLMRKGLVVFQIIASLILIVGTAIVYLQIDYMKSRDIGVDLNQVMALQVPSHEEGELELYVEKYKTLQNELMRNPNITAFGVISSIPGGGTGAIASTSGGVSIVGETLVDQSTYYITEVDEGAFSTLGIKLLVGRNFIKDRATDSLSIIVNETALKKMGYPDIESAIDKKLQFGTGDNSRRFNIVGVVRDYNRRSLREDIEPMCFLRGYNTFISNIALKVAVDSMEETIAEVESHWARQFPETPFEYKFLDSNFNQAYREDQRFGSLFSAFSLLAIFIAALGLFGLSSFMAIQRAKEISVRKVLGASVIGIVRLLFQDFLKLTILAFLLGSPLVYFIMNNWLDNYAFRIDLPFWTLPVGGLLLLLITFLTVGYQTHRAATANPANTLRHE